LLVPHPLWLVILSAAKNPRISSCGSFSALITRHSERAPTPFRRNPDASPARNLIGYGRATHLIDMMERDGLVGPADGSKPREILKAPDYYKEIDTALR
jgi:hypothetical protein